MRNYKLSISNYECDHLHFSICDYLRELFFLNFLTHAQIFSKTIPFLRGLFRFKKEVRKLEMGIENCQLRITEGHPVNKSSNR